MQLQTMLESLKEPFLIVTAIGGWFMFVELTKRFYWEYWSRSGENKFITSVYIVTVLFVAFGYVKAFDSFMGDWTSPQSETDLLSIMFFIVGVPILSDWVVYQYEKILKRKLEKEIKHRR